MKLFFNKLLLPLVMMGMLLFPSCEDYFGDVNVDPDNPLEVTSNVILTQVQFRLAYSYWGDASRHLGIFTQHIDGVGRQFAVYQNYGVQSNDVDQLWSNMYTGIIMDLRQILLSSEANGFNEYTGVAKALEAYTLLCLTDWFGDVPYSGAFQGAENLQPTFDAQEAVYNSIFTLITDARTALNAGDDGGNPLSGDVIYGNDIAQWVKFLNVLEARAYLHLGKVSDTNYQNALDALAKGGFESTGDDARVPFSNTTTGNAPWYQYIQQRDDIDAGSNYGALLTSLNDPREATHGFELTEDVSHPIFTPNRRTPLLSYTEAKFIEAEAIMKTKGASDAHPVYLEAIRASIMDDNGMDQASYNTYVGQAAVDPGAANLTMNEIMTQKYIALLADPEVFNDWRRTGIPALSPNSPPEVPRRLPYPQTELDSNTNTPSPAVATIFTKIWWDK